MIIPAINLCSTTAVLNEQREKEERNLKREKEQQNGSKDNKQKRG